MSWGKMLGAKGIYLGLLIMAELHVMKTPTLYTLPYTYTAVGKQNALTLRSEVVIIRHTLVMYRV